VFFGQVVFGRPGVPRPKNHTFSSGFLALVPRASKKPLGPQNHFGIPLRSGGSARHCMGITFLHRSVNSFRFLGFLLWLVLGPGGLLETPGGPGKAHGWLWGASRGPPDLPGPGPTNLKTHTFCRALLSGPVLSRNSAFRAGFWSDCYRESTEIGPLAGLRPAGGPISVRSR
jgi:hypothetical protein